MAYISDKAVKKPKGFRMGFGYTYAQVDAMVSAAVAIWAVDGV